MKIQPEFPLVSFTGHIKGSKLSFYVRNGQLVARTITQRKRQNTKDQVTVLRFQAQAVRHYRNLTIAQLAAWDDYAREHHPGAGLTGFQLFTKVQFLRQCLALPLSTDPPTRPPPPRVMRITPQPAATAPRSRARQSSGDDRECAHLTLFMRRGHL